MAYISELERLEAGTPILFDGDKVLRVPAEIAERFRRGDCVRVVEETQELLLIPAAERRVAEAAVERASAAFSRLASVAAADVSRFYASFAERLEDGPCWSRIRAANDEDVADAERQGRSTTRLVADEKLRAGMISGLRGWSSTESRHGQVVETVEHDGWRVELVGAPLGVVAFVFEGRPNVLADATGVLRGGNAVVFRIGRDALRTARSIMGEALEPALREAGLPEGAVSLVDSSAHAAGWALFCDRRVGLAVARGSGPAVTTLGALARQSGIPVSLHGTGGAWLVASETARVEAFSDAALRSLDRKVCNTLNVCCIPRARANELVPALLASAGRAGARLGQTYKLHVAEAARDAVPAELYERVVSVRRAEGDVREPQAETLPEEELGREWEWEQTPELTLALVADVDEAVALFNRYSPKLVACLVGEDAAEHDRFYESVNSPFVGDGFTRWVDGQLALGRPELGLSNWQRGRLFGRGGILSGETIFTLRTRAVGTSSEKDR